jgi:hypothetical protein
MTCENDYGIPNYEECSGHGLCSLGLSHRHCLCHDGWTSIGDFVLDEGYDCNINVQGLRIWSAINILLSTVAIMIISTCIYRQRALSYPRRYEIKSICLFLFFIDNLSVLMYSILKLIDPVFYVIGGTNVLVTVNMMVIIACTVYGIAGFFLMIVKFLKGYTRMMNSANRMTIASRLDLMSNLAVIIPGVFIIAFAAILLTVSLLPPSDSDRLNMAYLSCLAAAYVFYSASMIYVLNIFLSEMKSYLLSLPPEETDLQPSSAVASSTPSSPHSSGPSKTVNDVSQMYSKVRLAYILFAPPILFGIPLCIIFACWHILRRQVSYLIAFQFSLVSIISAFMIYSLAGSVTSRRTRKSFLTIRAKPVHASASNVNSSNIHTISSRREVMAKVSPVNRGANELEYNLEFNEYTAINDPARSFHPPSNGGALGQLRLDYPDIE